ncbi:hypothetical protein [Micromonospora humi]|uniref:Transcriptional regulator, AbiEi antitoxin, Type IV TA system n=1 Tax=Micromonospora humi TaxID=745366 RepID=A0A1C5JYC9_9ACTN|nr:hypothetical protein [Micromonospora humi]SCG75570.1 Transcriptional regulator, AbiEi antitoxin, Type IV TA system [Micromonospora humi]
MPPHPHRPPELAGQVFRGSDAVRRGLLSRHHLRGASWVRLRQDVYADARLDRDHELACRAVLLRMPPDALIAGPSAAYLHGVEHAAAFTDDVHVLLPATVRADSQPGVRVHHAPIVGGHGGLAVDRGLPRSGRHVPAEVGGPGDLGPSRRGLVTATPIRLHTPTATSTATATRPGSLIGPPGPAGRPHLTGSPHLTGATGPPRTAPAACAWETAVWGDPVRAVRIIDGLLRIAAVNQAALATEAARNAGRPGGRRAAWVFGLTDGCARSAHESHLRVRLVLAGLPRPVARHPVRVPAGLVRHPALAWPDFRVAVEYDRRRHADPDPPPDRHRLDELAEAGWLVLHVTGEHLRGEFPALVRKIRAALVARGWRP